MNIKKIILFFLALIVIAALLVFVLPKFKKNNTPIVPQETPGIEERIEEKFNGLIIPDDEEKTELKNVSGGEGIGIATRNEILADLPPLGPGESYQALISNGSKTVLLGSMRLAKGGYIIEYDSTKYPGYNQIIVSKGSLHILEGSF